MKRFSDFAEEETPLEGVKVKLDESDSPQVFFTGSGILIKQFERYKHELPFVARIKKINRYYTLS